MKPRNHLIVRVYNLILCGYKCCIFQIHVPGCTYSHYTAYPGGNPIKITWGQQSINGK